MSQVLERFGPLAIGFLVGLLAYWKIPDLQGVFDASQGPLSRAFAPVFDMATFSAGTLFAIYVLALSRADGFLGKIFETQTFRLFHRYVASGVILSITLSMWSATYLVLGGPSSASGWPLIAASAWVGLAIWAMLAVARVVLIFLVIVGAKTGHPNYTGPAE